eukprot:CAMPEP_0194747648 /NCGR_PEP_ID=MMETSP0323_2-20130528/1805_1 /TAXON_ID=2866 ORGANISM="Crypthecodinium cohnii, Strain Seligo" /NCGR_SAMPLE_ID=MMETSP0323_2 /ASSEMBLY_ACC=CAM_ASM_000346 /LENGTH=64 /DNA_ID=CAMNT_0039661259 /DNA_START=465 /DNA_END=656 /DNA_ORIENTATION=+
MALRLASLEKRVHGTLELHQGKALHVALEAERRPDVVLAYVVVYVAIRPASSTCGVAKTTTANN